MINSHDPLKSRQSESHLEYSGTEELIDSEEGLARYNRDVVKKSLKASVSIILAARAYLFWNLGRVLECLPRFGNPNIK